MPINEIGNSLAGTTLHLAGGEAIALSATNGIADGFFQMHLRLGEDPNYLDSGGATLTVRIYIDNVPGSPIEAVVESGRVRWRMDGQPIYIPSGAEVKVTVESDNPNDTSVEAFCGMRDTTPLQPTTAGRKLNVNLQRYAEIDAPGLRLALGFYTGDLADQLSSLSDDVTAATTAAAAAQGAAESVEVVTDKLDTMLEAESEYVSGTWQFTVDALANAPTGDGMSASGIRDAIGLASANLDTQLGGLAQPGDTMLIDMTQATPGASDVGTQLDASGTGGGSGGLTQADVRTAVGLVAANLDTQLGAIGTNAAEVLKIPRADAALTAGGAVEKTNLSNNNATMEETLKALP